MILTEVIAKHYFIIAYDILEFERTGNRKACKTSFQEVTLAYEMR